MKNSLKLFIANSLSFAIVLKTENKVIGNIGMDKIIIDESLKHLNQGYIGYRLNSNYWGNGYATESTQYFVKYLFKNLDLDLIWSSHFDFNNKSKRVIEKCSFNYKFTRNKKVEVLNDITVSELFYSLNKSDFF